MGFTGRPIPAWYDDAKFGIFIHWGPYAVPCYAPVDFDMGELFASGSWREVFRHSPYTEWYLNSWALEGSPVAVHHEQLYGDRSYASFVDEFHERSNAVDIGHWAHLFAAAGARYVVPVTKHHDGYLMWQSEIANPHRQRWMAERDHVADLAAGVHEAGMRLGLYYSGGIDWTFVPPPIADLASMATAIPDSAEYRAYATAHVQELIDRFEPCALWNDIGWPAGLDANDIIAYYYDRVPDGVVNDRFDMMGLKGDVHADISTPEYSTNASSRRKWEVCRGVGRSFGYNRMETDDTLLAVDDLIWMLVDIVARGGNLLLNVGPTADGQIPLAQATRLTALGWWLRVNGSAIYGTRRWNRETDVAADGRDVRYTAGADGTVYAIVAGAPTGTLELPAMVAGEGSVVTMLGNGRALPHTVRDDALVIELRDHQPAAPATAFALQGFSAR